jgi:hypothetical protein
MIGNEETQRVADEFLDEMLEAEEKHDYQLFIRQFEKKDIESLMVVGGGI